MHIAVFLFEFPKLSETFVLNQITSMIDAKHEVDIFPYNWGSTNDVHEGVNKYKLLERSFFTPHIPVNWLARLLKAIWLLLIYGHRNPLALVKALNVFKYGHLAASLTLFYQTISIIKGRYKYDIIHCHFGDRGNDVLRFKELGAITGKVAISFYGCDLTIVPANGLPAHYSELFKKADLFLPISKFFADLLIEAGCPKEKVLVNHVGVDIKLFSYHVRNRSVTEPLRLLSVARLTEKKGLEDAIRAVAKARRQGCNCTYDIIGSGLLRNKLEQIIHEEKASEYIQLLGQCTHQELKYIILEKDVFILPSVTALNGDMEGIPLSLMEASASGMPIISTWHSGIPELVIHGASGYLAVEHDVETIAHFIMQMASHPELCVELGRQGRAIVEKKFSISSQAKFLEQAFQEVINQATS